MATTRDFIAALAPVCGIHPATLDKYMREIRGIGLIPSGGRGGGIASAHLNHEHAAAVILSLAAPTPGGAVAAYNAVKDLDRDNVQAGDFAGLGFTLATTIQTTASSILAGQKPFEHPEANKWELTICLDPVTVWQSWIVDGTERREGFSDRQSVLPRPVHPQDVHRGIRRQTIITSAVLNVAAELVADTMQHEATKAGRQNSLQEAMTIAEHCDRIAHKLNNLVDEKLAQVRAEYAALTAEQAARNVAHSADLDRGLAALRAKLHPENAGAPSNAPQNETAATPAREAAAVSDQTVQTDVVGSIQPHRKRERKFPQASVSSSGHPSNTRTQNDEPDRYSGLNFAPA